MMMCKRSWFIPCRHVTTTGTGCMMTSGIFPMVLGLSIVLLTLATSGVDGLTEAEGYCDYVTSNTVSYQAAATFSEMVRTTKGCGFFGWSSCTIYREVYKTRLETRYRIDKKKAQRCCEGWIEEDTTSMVPVALRCTRIVQPTTRPTATPSPSNSTSTVTGRIPTPELPVNYSIITTESAVISANKEGTTDLGSLPGGPVSNPGGGGLFTGENKTRNLIALIGVIAGVLLVIIVVSTIAVCYRKRKRKRHRKSSDAGVALALLNRRGEPPTSPASNGRPGDSTYAEIPDGQTQIDRPNNTTTTTPAIETADGADENHNPASPAPRGGNQYQEIADVLNQAEDAGVGIPTNSFTDSHLPDESRGGYAYAYIDSKELIKDGQKDAKNSDGKAKLKGGAAAKYAEVNKAKSPHPKSPGSTLDTAKGIVHISPAKHEMIPTEIQAYITHVPTNGTKEDESSRPSDAQNTDNTVRDESYDLVKTGITSPQPYDEVQFGVGMDPEPYDEVKFSINRIPQSDEYDIVQMSDGKQGLFDDDPQPYGDLGPQPYGNIGPSSSCPDNTGYNKFKRSNSRQEICEIDPSGYGVVLSDAQDSNKKPGSNHYATLDSHSANDLSRSPLSRPPQSKEYDRLDRQISTTSSQGSPTKSRRNKISPTYSKLNRSASSRQDGAATLPVAYGNIGDDGHGVPTVYDKLKNVNPLSAQIPVQDTHDLTSGKDKGDNDSNPPEGPYATIPNDLFTSIPADNYDKLDVIHINHKDNGAIQSNNSASPAAVYDKPGVSSTGLSGFETMYENTPKENRSSHLSDSGLSSISATYDTPLSRQCSVGDPTDPTCDITTYDTPLSHSVPSPRHGSFGNPTSDTYDRPTSRHSLTNQDESNSTYDTPRNSVSRNDTFYENAASKKRHSDDSKPVQYELMERQDSIVSNASTGSYEDMRRESGNLRSGSRGSRGSLDIAVPSPLSKSHLTRQDTLYENTARDSK